MGALARIASTALLSDLWLQRGVMNLAALSFLLIHTACVLPGCLVDFQHTDDSLHGCICIQGANRHINCWRARVANDPNTSHAKESCRRCLPSLVTGKAGESLDKCCICPCGDMLCDQPHLMRLSQRFATAGGTSRIAFRWVRLQGLLNL